MMDHVSLFKSFSFDGFFFLGVFRFGSCLLLNFENRNINFFVEFEMARRGRDKILLIQREKLLRSQNSLTAGSKEHRRCSTSVTVPWIGCLSSSP